MGKTQNTPKILIAIGAVLIVASGLYFSGIDLPFMPSSANAESSPSTKGDGASEQNAAKILKPSPTTAPALPLEEALEIRTMGDKNAPVTLREMSSLTCGHCGAFHKNTFSQLKAEYIDTGKVRLIFDDFPLDGVALQASMAARCVPKDRYFDLIEFLFDKQDDWTHSRSYLAFIKQSARLAGLSSDGFDACMSNEELRQGLLDNIKNAQSTYKVSSTPSFVIDGGEVFSGARPFSFFKEKLDAALEKAGKL